MEAHQFVAEGRVVRDERREAIAACLSRALDITLALLALIVLAPLLLAIAVAVRLDSSGPVLFRQRRVGRYRREFTLLKFRTMRPDADSARHRDYVASLIHDDGTRARESGLYKLVDDRITRAGRTLRRLSLDELPQLWNVLRGEMSIIGPRPAIPYEVEMYPESWLERFLVKPGMTGLWQVSGRNERTYEEMVRLDIEYVRRRSLGGDLLIVIRTAWVVLRGRGAA